ncbi:MAG: NADP-dependent phosphogluconate dehydrogenase [Geminicoccaceae bacterium]|nr:NADP-dependent phosphogluconate dehydrogenase [Geminicoccaceae bacterium]
MNRAERVGLLGLGVMGRNLALNLRDHGFDVLAFDPNPTARAAAAALGFALADRPEDLAQKLPPPRTLVLLVPAGAAVDAALEDLARHLRPGDVVLDGGNSHWRETARRARRLGEKGIELVGLGVSGGEEGARFGPSLMVGASEPAWRLVRPLLEAIAARGEDGSPCCARLGPPPAGHLVKTVHNGIEYALMELLAEAFDLARRSRGSDHETIAELFETWRRGLLDGFLLRAAVRVLRTPDPETRGPLLASLRDVAEHKGTGSWAAIEALERGVSAPTLHAAVDARLLSSAVELRRELSPLFPSPVARAETRRAELESALVAAAIAAFAQGFALLRAAFAAEGWPFAPLLVARVWRAGSILRGRLLEPIARAFERDPDLPCLLLDDELLASVLAGLSDLRAAVSEGAASGVPVPALAASLAYLDGLASARLPADLIQGMRDLFGRHGFERIDRPGRFHDLWRGRPSKGSP